MPSRSLLAGAMIAAAAFAPAFVAGGASAANVCRTNTTTCATTMPIDGYCECTADGMSQGGTVVQGSAARPRSNAAAAGMGRGVMSAPGYGKNAAQSGCGGEPSSDPGCK